MAPRLLNLAISRACFVLLASAQDLQASRALAHGGSDWRQRAPLLWGSETDGSRSWVSATSSSSPAS